MFFVVLISTAILSYMSAIPPGIVNIRVIETSLFKGFGAAKAMALGAIVPELVYSILAVVAGDFLYRFPIVQDYIGWFMVLLFLGMAIYEYRKSLTPKSFDTEDIRASDIQKNKGTYFMQGVGYGMINPQMFPYWLTTLLYIKNIFPYREINYFNEAFVLGAVLGGWALLYTYAWLAHYKKVELFNFLKRVNFNKLTFILFLVLFLIQLIKMISSIK